MNTKISILIIEDEKNTVILLRPPLSVRDTALLKAIPALTVSLRSHPAVRIFCFLDLGLAGY